jgi:predicted nucleotidyltransferase
VSAIDPNVEMIEYIARALGDRLPQFIFVGGCAAGLLVTDPERAAIRATNDVDLIVEVSGRGDYYLRLVPELRSVGFRESEENTCRWTYNGVKVDVMPTDPGILSFSNEWYEEAFRQARNFVLPSGTEIRIISAPLLLLTKIAAFHGRGQGDFQGSHDLEDLIAVIDGRPETVDEVLVAGEEIRGALEDEVSALLGNEQFTSAIGYHLRPDQVSQGRITIVIERLRAIAGL